MHPILARGGRLALYLALWVAVGVLLGALLAAQVGLGWQPAGLVALPLALLYSFVCLSAWYVSRGMPLAATGAVRIVATALTASAISSAMWLLAARSWVVWLSRRGLVPAPGSTAGLYALLSSFGLLLYLLSLAVSYLIAVFEHTRAAERRALQVQVLAREAELRMLRAQIDPHFLFNSLHSISALTGANPAAARRMCVLLADFLRDSLALGAETRITLGRELGLVARFLAVERVRYGDRLRDGIVVGAGTDECLLPPLLLLPLVENAVTHGVAHMIAGGTVTVTTTRLGSRLQVAVENPCDPDRPRRGGPGVGLANVRARLLTLHGDDARFTAGERDGVWRVELSLPVAIRLRSPTPDAVTTMPESLRVAIVDDEPLARAMVREYLGLHPGVEIVAECANGFEAVKAVTELAPELLFLDVQMPKLSGFEVLELIGREVPVIFTTAYDQYALRAFEVHAVDYLLKPFSEERFAEALSRARERLRARAQEGPDPAVVALAEDVRAKGPLERVLIRDGAQVHVLPVERIDYVEAQDDYVCFVADGRQHLKDQTLAAAEAQLDPARFVRIHRSYLLNIERIARVELYAKDSRVAILRDGRRLPVSRAGYARLAKLL